MALTSQASQHHVPLGTWRKQRVTHLAEPLPRPEDSSADDFSGKLIHFCNCCSPHLLGWNGPSNNQAIILHYFLSCLVLSCAKNHQKLSLHSWLSWAWRLNLVCNRRDPDTVCLSGHKRQHGLRCQNCWLAQSPQLLPISPNPWIAFHNLKSCNDGVLGWEAIWVSHA